MERKKLQAEYDTTIKHFFLSHATVNCIFIVFNCQEIAKERWKANAEAFAN